MQSRNLVYLLLNKKGEPIYVGKVLETGCEICGDNVADWIQEVNKVKVIDCRKNRIMSCIELYYLKIFQPIHNIKDEFEEDYCLQIPYNFPEKEMSFEEFLYKYNSGNKAY
ncbi:MAG: hypothetical protein RR364_08610 [Lachnospiraceae bacterium]